MIITIDIPAARIADLMVTAIEGGIGYWCTAVRLKDAKHSGALDYRPVENPWYSDPGLYDCQDFTLEVDVDEDENGEVKTITVTREAFIDGFRRFAKNSHFGDFVGENEDAGTGDVFLQFVALGEVIYG